MVACLVRAGVFRTWRDAFEGVRGIAALQVSLGHFFTYFADAGGYLEMGGGGAVLSGGLELQMREGVVRTGAGPLEGRLEHELLHLLMLNDLYEVPSFNS